MSGSETVSRRRRARSGRGMDGSAAPLRYGGDDGARPGSWRRAWQNSVWVYLVGLPFLLLAVPSIRLGNPSASVVALRVALVLLIGVGYVATVWVIDTSLGRRWAYVGGFVVLLLSTALTWGWSFAYFGVYVAIMVATLIPWRQARVAVMLWSAVLVGFAVFSGEPALTYIALVAAVSALALGSGIESGRVAGRLNRAEQRVAALAVVAERERISRDLHDILGHSLTAIAIKSELARRLVEVDPARASAQIAEVEEIARQALGDVRATASAIREVRAATELAGARSVLEAAGITAHLPSAVPALDDEVSELFGYVIREAVTNVVRHSEARQCTITITEHQVTVTDDGTGRVTRRDGTGLAGLTWRMAAAGGRLEVTAARDRGTTLTAELEPVDGPERAAEPRPAALS